MTVAMMTTALQAIAEGSVRHIALSLLEGTLVALVAGVGLRLSRHQSSGTKFAVWFSALMAIAALPLSPSLVSLHADAASRLVKPVITLPGSWAMYLLGVWVVIAAWCLLRVAHGLVHLGALRKSCVPVDSQQLDGRLRDTLVQKSGARTVSLCVSHRVQVPTAIGLVRPMVVVPVWLLDELSSDELNQILLHELAHLRRWDDWTNLAQQLVKALFFFHPAVWWIERKLSLEREMACDDAVVAETASPRAYAECLTRLAEKSFLRRSLALAQAALGRVQQTSLRIAQILDGNRPRKTKRVWVPAGLLAGFTLLCGSIAVEQPALISFDHAQSHAGVVAMDTSANPVLKPIPAAFHPVRAQVVRPVSRMPVKTHPRSNHAMKPQPVEAQVPQFAAFESVLIIESSTVTPKPVNFTSSNAEPVVSTESVFLVLNGQPAGDSRQPTYEIHVWRLTVMHSNPNAAGVQIPSKKT